MSQNNINIEDVLKSIMAQTGLSKTDVLKRAKEVMTSTGGLLTLVGASLILADKLHVKLNLNGETSPEPSPDSTGNDDTIKIKDLVSGMKNVNVVGRVTAIYPAKKFSRKDGREGKVASMTIIDGTGKVRVTTWDNKTEEINGLNIGDVVGIYNANVKNGMKGFVEINTDNRTGIKKNPDGVDNSSIPSDNGQPGATTSQIKDITESMKNVTFVATVTKKLDPRDFTKKDGTPGTISKIVATDGTGNATINFWTENTKEYNDLVIGKTYEFSNIGVKFNLYRNELEFTVTKSTGITMISVDETEKKD